jgi:hypothetical protein
MPLSWTRVFDVGTVVPTYECSRNARLVTLQPIEQRRLQLRSEPLADPRLLSPAHGAGKASKPSAKIRALAAIRINDVRV